MSIVRVNAPPPATAPAVAREVAGTLPRPTSPAPAEPLRSDTTTGQVLSVTLPTKLISPSAAIAACEAAARTRARDKPLSAKFFMITSRY
ncbi:hypothetical protein D3C81_2066730 [compost metagenome]